MVDVKDGMKYWRDAGHVARRTLEATKDVLTVGTPWKDVIEFAERHIHRHGGSPAFPTTIGVNEIAAHFTPDHSNLEPQDWEGDMVLKNGDLVKIDVGVHIKGHIGDNALTFEVGNKNNHTDQIKAAREARDASIELMHPGTPWYKIGAAAGQASKGCWIQTHQKFVWSSTQTLGPTCRGFGSIVCLR